MSKCSMYVVLATYIIQYTLVRYNIFTPGLDLEIRVRFLTHNFNNLV